MKRLKDLVTIALLLSLNIVLSRFLSISAWNIKIGFTFTTIFIAGYFYGPLGGALIGGLGDFLGAMLFPIGPYFYGFTVTAILTGLLFGFLLRKQYGMPQMILAAGINEFGLSLFLNTYWIHKLYKANYWALFSTRIFQCVVIFAVELVVFSLFKKYLPALERRFNSK